MCSLFIVMADGEVLGFGNRVCIGAADDSIWGSREEKSGSKFGLISDSAVKEKFGNDIVKYQTE